MLFTPLAPFETPAAVEAICESFNRVADTQEIDPLILIPVFAFITSPVTTHLLAKTEVKFHGNKQGEYDEEEQ